MSEAAMAKRKTLVDLETILPPIDRGFGCSQYMTIMFITLPTVQSVSNTGKPEITTHVPISRKGAVITAKLMRKPVLPIISTK